MTDPLAGLTADTFMPYIGTLFSSSSAEAELTLVEVEVRESAGVEREPFTLTFTSPSSFGQGTHDLDHPAIGRLNVFLVPRQPLADGVPRYDAVFN